VLQEAFLIGFATFPTVSEFISSKRSWSLGRLSFGVVLASEAAWGSFGGLPYPS